MDCLQVRPCKTAGQPRDKEGGPEDLCPGPLTKPFFFFFVGFAWGIPIILFRLEGDGVPGTETLF